MEFVRRKGHIPSKLKKEGKNEGQGEEEKI